MMETYRALPGCETKSVNFQFAFILLNFINISLIECATNCLEQPLCMALSYSGFNECYLHPNVTFYGCDELLDQTDWKYMEVVRCLSNFRIMYL